MAKAAFLMSIESFCAHSFRNSIPLCLIMISIRLSKLYGCLSEHLLTKVCRV